VAAPAEPAPAPAPEPQTLCVPANDGSVSGVTAALATSVREAYSRLGRDTVFHRIAVPTFSETDGDVSKHHLGQVVAELMASELGKQPPFTVVERNHLDQVMKEYRLADLGVVDKHSAAQFGKILGAQSILSGSVSEAGPRYILNARLVDVETGQVLVAGSTEMQKAGLVALSTDAVVLRSKSGALFRTALIPGWGQFNNRNNLKGAAFLGAGLATAGTALGFYMASQSAATLYNQRTPDTVGYRDVANNRVRVANAALIGYGVVWLVGMLDAYISGGDSTSVELPGGGA
jgi:TolB-like protein